MNELEIAAAVLAAVALPLVGIGPMLLRVLRPLPFALVVGGCAAIVFVLTRAPWAAAFTLCLGGALLWRRPAHLRAQAEALRLSGFTQPGSEGDPA